MKSENPAQDLMRFYCEVLKKSPNTEDIKLFRELITLFGTLNVYMCILDLATAFTGRKGFSSGYSSGYLKKILSSRIKENLRANTGSVDLTDFVEDSKRKIEEAKEKRINAR